MKSAIESGASGTAGESLKTAPIESAPTPGWSMAGAVERQTPKPSTFKKRNPHTIMKNKLRSICAAFRRMFTRTVQLANETKAALESIFLPNAFLPKADNWVQLSPFGDFGNKDAKGNRVIQRFRKEDAEHICNEFNGLARKITQPLGMPFYVGHPDHPRFKGQPGHSDTAAKGRGKEFAVRHDAACAACTAFANSKDGKADLGPCGEHGLFVKMHWNHDGEELISNEAFHGHSVNWAAVPDGKEGNAVIMRPVRVKSTGFTNEPNIPVTPAQLANEEPGEEIANEGPAVPPKLKVLAGFAADAECTMEDCIAALEKKAQPTPMANEVDAHAFLESVFLANGDVVGHEFHGNQNTAGKAAMKTSGPANKATASARQSDSADDHAKARDAHESAFMAHHAAQQEAEGAGDKASAEFHQSVKFAHAKQAFAHGIEERRVLKEANRQIANQADFETALTAKTELETQIANEKAALAAERKARAALAVEPLVKAGKVILADKDKRIEELCNAADFDAAAALLTNVAPVVKTVATSAGLAGKNTVIVADTRERTAKFEALMTQREQELPNEAYQDRFEHVANSAEGTALFASMQRANAPVDKKD